MKKRLKRCPEMIMLADNLDLKRCVLNGKHPGKNHCTVATGWATNEGVCQMQVPMEISWPNKTSR